jgi:16S rRNA (cytosine1402-N4)-methyltransferase
VDQHGTHTPVLYVETLSVLNIVPGGWYVDGTIGAAGHAQGILIASAPDGHLLGLDVDAEALEVSRQRLTPFADRVVLARGSFAQIREVATAQGFDQVDGALLDLGVSSLQLADPSRGFTFQNEGPLDMRLDTRVARTAAYWVNEVGESDLADVVWRYGEEPAARSIARAIVAARPLQTTTKLAEVVSEAVKHSRARDRRHREGMHHPATRTFQALRIAVNAELESLEQGLQGALAILKPGGRLAVITFHSLEDRVVKQFFMRETRDCICPPEALVCACGHSAQVVLVNRKPILPSPGEVSRNPRSRSAKLRVVARK